MRKFSKEKTLDPGNWDEIRALGHLMFDGMLDVHQNIRSFRLTFPTNVSQSKLNISNKMILSEL